MSDNIIKNQKSNILDILDNSKISRIIFLIILGISGITFRFVFFPYDVPFFCDSQGYFWHAIDMSILKQFPPGYGIVNNGWPMLLSFFFQLTNSNNFLDFQNIQRVIGVLFSVFTIIPIYLLCSKFFKKSYALLASSLFIFEPRIILNSLIGTPESVYVFLISISLVLFLSNNIKKIYLSFLILGFITLMRYEGLLLIIPFTVIFFIRFRKQKSEFIKYIFCIIAFVLVLAPISYFANDVTGQDGIISHISAGPNYYQTSINENNSTVSDFLITGSSNLVKFLAWIHIPSFLIFVPLGIIFIFKKFDYNKITIVATIIIMLIPAFYAYSRDFSETKYLFALYPSLCLLSCYTFKIFLEKTKRKNLIFIIILVGIILSSLIFVQWKAIDNEHFRESYQIVDQISNKEITINSDFGTHGGEFVYFHWTRLHNVDDFPILKNDLPESKISYNKQAYTENGKRIHNLQYDDKSKITNLDDYFRLLQKQQVTHLLVDKGNISVLISSDLRSELQNIFHNEKNYPFLIKEYDSKENGFKYHVKLFKINYESMQGI